MRLTRFLDSLLQDLKYALTSLRSAPGFAAVTLVSLALGIGANTALFSLLDAVMLKSLPVREPDRLVVLDDGSWTNPIWEAIRDDSDAFEGVTAWGNATFDLGAGGETQFVRGIFASGSYFEVLGVEPLIGRTFTPSEDRRGCGAEAPSAVLSYGFWQRQYGGSSDVLGQPLRLDGVYFNVVGVAPPRFFGLSVGEAFDVAVPICAEAAVRGAESGLDRRSFWWLEIVGRLRPDSTRTEAQAALQASQARIREATLPDWPAEYLAEYLEEPLTLSSARAGVSRLRDRYGESLLVLMGISGLVLLVACANIANLLLARASARSRELAVRISVGASRSRLTRQLLIESIVVGSLGAAAGILLARWASRVLVTQLSTGARPVFLDITLDERVLAFNAAVGIATGLLFGIYPALRAARRAPSDALRETTRGVHGSGSASRWLVTVQVALSLVLLFGAALFIRSYAALVTLDPGFDRSSVLTLRADIRRAPDADSRRAALFEEVLEAVRATPGVSVAAATAVTPISGASWNDAIEVDGYVSTSREDRMTYYNYVTPGYFRALATPLLAGRDIDEHDAADTPLVAVVNETFNTKFFGGDALGKSYRVRVDGEWQDVAIVGIVTDAKYRSLDEPVPPTAYAPHAQMPRTRGVGHYVVRGRGDLESLRTGIVEQVGRVIPEAALSFRTLESQVEDSLVQERLLATLSAIFGVLALTVSAVGLAGLVAYGVSRRRAELGIRSALGATPRGLVLLVLRDVAIVTSVGLALGAAAALASGRFVASLLFGLGAGDAGTLLLAAGALAFVAGSASLWPASRAARIDAMECLRSE